MDTVDILLATYNGEKYLFEQIESLLNQTYKQINIIIRDDGSTDSTVQIIDSFAREHDNIHIVKDNLCNVGAARNFSILINCSTSRYVMFCDQDDVWFPEKVEKTLSIMKKEEEKTPNTGILVHSNLIVVDESKAVVSNSFFQYQKIDCTRKKLDNLFLVNPVTGCTVMVNRNLLLGVGEIPYTITMHDNWLALYASIAGKIITIDSPLMYYRQHSSNVIGAYKAQGIFHSLEVVRKISHYKKVLRGCFNVVREILSRYADLMTEDEIVKCRTFLKLEDSNPFTKFWIVMHNDYYRDSVYQKLRFFFLLLVY